MDASRDKKGHPRKAQRRQCVPSLSFRRVLSAVVIMVAGNVFSALINTSSISPHLYLLTTKIHCMIK